MAAEITDSADGLVTVRLTGRLTEPDILAVQREVGAAILARGRVSILVLAEAFAGWEQGGKWDSFAAQEQIDPHIDGMAIVGEPRWEDLALVFAAKGLRPFPIEYFASDDGLTRARAWLESTGDAGG